MRSEGYSTWSVCLCVCRSVCVSVTQHLWTWHLLGEHHSAWHSPTGLHWLVWGNPLHQSALAYRTDHMESLKDIQQPNFNEAGVSSNQHTNSCKSVLSSGRNTMATMKDHLVISCVVNGCWWHTLTFQRATRNHITCMIIATCLECVNPPGCFVSPQDGPPGLDPLCEQFQLMVNLAVVLTVN